jgi:hypothetical protein
MNLQFVNSLLPSKWHCFPFHASVCEYQPPIECTYGSASSWYTPLKLSRVPFLFSS